VPTALVTGASTGIGREFARQLSAAGHDVVLVARDATRLEAVAGELRRADGTQPEVLPADLVVAAELATVEARVADPERPVDLVVNNAGFGGFGDFVGMDIDREEAEIRLNVIALVRLTHAAVAAMVPRGTGAVVNVSSLTAYQPTPRNATYAATKAFVNSFTQAVHEEVRERGVHVQLVCPGFTRTEFHERSGPRAFEAPGFMWQQPEQVVAASLRDLERRRAVTFPGALNGTLAVFASVAPAGFSRRVVGAVLKRTE
jgi:short-subunit dehydrogenase